MVYDGDGDADVSMMKVMMLMVIVVSVQANVSDVGAGHSDGDVKERMWDDDAVHDDNTITDDAMMIISEWVMSGCECVSESECEWLMVAVIADDHDGTMTC
eukprot:4817708-Pyramimonas_sp.AAC.1